MSQIFRVFIRHESDAQPAYIKVRSELSFEEFVSELEKATAKPAPSVWRCTDIEHHTWVFRADKIYTVCVYPPELEPEVYVGSMSDGGSDEVSEDTTPPTAKAHGTDPAAISVSDTGTLPVADSRTYDDLSAAEKSE